MQRDDGHARMKNDELWRDGRYRAERVGTSSGESLRLLLRLLLCVDRF